MIPEKWYPWMEEDFAYKNASVTDNDSLNEQQLL